MRAALILVSLATTGCDRVVENALEDARREAEAKAKAEETAAMQQLAERDRPVLSDREVVARTGGPATAKSPFDADSARAYQAAWSRFLKRDVSSVNAIGMEMRLIPPGEFTVTFPPRDAEGKLHFNYGDGDVRPRTATINAPLLMSAHEVTQAQFNRVTGLNPSSFSASGGFRSLVKGVDTSHFPVESVRWNEAIEFCNALSALESLPPYYERADDDVVEAGGTGYRLPTELEWEFACRAGSQGAWCFGDDETLLSEYACYAPSRSERPKRPLPVGSLKCNAFGLFDLHGNVREWVADRQAKHLKVIRGGAFNDLASEIRSDFRGACTSRDAVLGFRPVRTLSVK